MAKPRPIGDRAASPLNTGESGSKAPPSRNFTPSPTAPVGTPPLIPNIPPRGSISGAAGPRSLSTSQKPSPALKPKSPSATPKPSMGDLGRKMSPTPVASGSSALTSALATSPKPGDSSFDTPQRAVSRKDSTPAIVRTGNESGIGTPAAGESSFSNLAEIPDAQKAKVLARHLLSAEERGSSSKNTPAPPSPEDTSMVDDHGDYGNQGPGESSMSYGATQDDDSHFTIPYDAPGMDITHDLYKWQHDHRRRPTRSASFSHIPLDRSTILDPTLAHIKEPGGFRRNFVVNRAQEQGLEPPSVIRNVVDFLFLYGHFAGEDLEEDEDDDTDDDFPSLEHAENGDAYARDPEALRESIRRGQSSERQPLLGPPSNLSRGLSKTRHRRTRSGPGQGTATMTQAVLMLLKGFVGTGIMFMGKAFFNGGLVFSTVVMLSIAAISLWSFLLLCKAYLVIPGSFGDMGGALYGNWLRLTILFSIAISQIGFVAAYTIFIAENLQAFVLAVTDCRTYIPTRYMIFAQLIIFMPLAMIRNIAKLSGTALVADAFILIGLVYIGVNEISMLTHHGIADVVGFNRDSFPLLIGTAVFAFEGVGLVIPITESMKEPQKFPRVLTGCMIVVAVLFAGAGFLGYAAYGSAIQTVVIVNLPQEDKFVQAVQFLYSVAILLSTPLQLFPAVRIMENGVFNRSGKHNSSVKWQKNVFRAGVVVFCSLLSWAGSNELDKFVALVGSFACIPLCFIYPPMLHLRACAHTRTAKALDIALITFGIAVGVYTTVQTIGSLFQPSEGPPQFGKCKIPDDTFW